MASVSRSLIALSLFVLLAGTLPLSAREGCPAADALQRDHLNLRVDFSAAGDGSRNDAPALQAGIACSAALGMRLYIPSGKYLLTETVFLESQAHIYGNDRSTELLVKAPVGLSIRDGSFADEVVVRNLTFRYVKRADSSRDDIAMLLRSHQRSRFEFLRFRGFRDQVIAHLAPNFKTRPPHNIVFNTYRNWFVDQCRIGVIYEGMGQKPDRGAISVISNNTWYDITFRRVGKSAIIARSWVDSERWYNLYAQAANDNAVIVNLNPKPIWNQVDRIHFYSPVLVFAPNLRGGKAKSITGIRLGKGVNRVFGYGIISDKNWPSPLWVDDGATSFHLTFGHQGRGSQVGPRIVSKGMSVD